MAIQIDVQNKQSEKKKTNCSYISDFFHLLKCVHILNDLLCMCLAGWLVVAIVSISWGAVEKKMERFENALRLIVISTMI